MARVAGDTRREKKKHPATVIQTAGAVPRSFTSYLDPIKVGNNKGNSTADYAAGSILLAGLQTVRFPECVALRGE